MAAIDYVGIRNTMKTLLDADALTNTARIYVEEEPQFGLSDEPAIAMFMDSRSANGPDQSLSQGKRTRYKLRMSFWVLFFSLESYKAACDGRDALLANLELVLMSNRTIGDKVTTSWLEGGEMFSARHPQSSMFTAAAEVILVAEVSAINT